VLYERIRLYGRWVRHSVPEMDWNPGNPKIFLLQHRDENIGEMKIPWHKSHDVFQRSPMHEPVGNISAFNPGSSEARSGECEFPMDELYRNSYRNDDFFYQ
jgi:hypothetical protein